MDGYTWKMKNSPLDNGIPAALHHQDSLQLVKNWLLTIFTSQRLVLFTRKINPS